LRLQFFTMNSLAFEGTGGLSIMQSFVLFYSCCHTPLLLPYIILIMCDAHLWWIRWCITNEILLKFLITSVFFGVVFPVLTLSWLVPYNTLVPYTSVIDVLKLPFLFPFNIAEMFLFILFCTLRFIFSDSLYVLMRSDLVPPTTPFLFGINSCSLFFRFNARAFLLSTMFCNLV